MKKFKKNYSFENFKKWFLHEYNVWRKYNTEDDSKEAFLSDRFANTSMQAEGFDLSESEESEVDNWVDKWSMEDTETII